MEAARQQYEAAKNGAAQQYQALQAARARVAMARKALADTVVRAPFDGRGRRAAGLGRRLRHRGHEGRGRRARQSAARAADGARAVRVRRSPSGQPVTFEVDAYPGRQFAGQGALRLARAAGRSARADGRSRSCPTPSGELKPGLFATARIEQPQPTPGVLVPAAAVQHQRRHEPRLRRQRRPRRRADRHHRPDGRRRWSRSPTGSRPASAWRRRTSRSSPTAVRSRRSPR